VYEPVRKAVTGFVVDPLCKHHVENVSVESLTERCAPGLCRPDKRSAIRRTALSAMQFAWDKIGEQYRLTVPGRGS
ncbi:hypothetical protein ACQWF9_27495, partial [Salmonella enterica subsp. enterica serovar Infantis]